jgi:hypothetical protein
MCGYHEGISDGVVFRSRALEDYTDALIPLRIARRGI